MHSDDLVDWDAEHFGGLVVCFQNDPCFGVYGNNGIRGKFNQVADSTPKRDK
jgi:hypothetical protein